jgi:hypothetical protein
MRRLPTQFSTIVLTIVVPWLATTASAQTITAGDTTYTFTKISGTVQQAGPGWVVVKTLTSPIRVGIDELQLNKLLTSPKRPLPTKPVSVIISGDADISIVQKGMGVTFSAELKNGKGVEKVTELTLFNPSPATPPSLTATGAVEDGPGLPTGQFIVSGEVKSLGKGKLNVVAPNDKGRPTAISVDLADAVQVKARLGDLSFAQPGDTVTAEGYIISKINAPGNIMMGQTVEVTLSKPLMSKAKQRELAAADKDQGRGKSARSKAAKDKPTETGDANKLLPFAEPAVVAEAAKPNRRKPEADAAVAQADDDRIKRLPTDPQPAELVIEDVFEVDAVTLFDDDEGEK